MVSLENEPLESMITGFQLYKKDVDDTVIICDSHCDLNHILQIFNSCPSAMGFTLVSLNGSKSRFLNVELTLITIETSKRSIYKQSMWNGQLTNFHSWVSMSSKQNLLPLF
ncbi:unnamed protein product [Heterobilharzia americana]|nr:unnamed protein product [Heterobilharzia americana]